jgi:hypothetical protein
MRFVLFGFVFLFAMAARLSATIYYVDYTNGNDANSGTNQKVPWKHCPGDPAATGFPAGATLQPGDTVLFRGGVTYVFTGATGIALNWNGSATWQITYDGNSNGQWGPGRAKFTDNYGGNAITAFFANQPRYHLVFKSLEIVGVGGAASLPPDQGTPLPARFGGGIAFRGGAENVVW